MLPRLVAAVLAVCLALAAAMAAAQEAATDPSPTALPAPPPAALQVGLPDLGRPLAYRGADGEPAGLLVELWRMVEPELGELNITLCGTASACLVDLEAQLLDLAGPMDLGAGGAARYSQPVLSLAMGAVTPGVGEQDARALRLARVGVLERRSRGTADAAPPGCPTRDCRAVRRWHPDEVRLVEEEAAVAALGDRYDVIVGPYAALRRLFASGGPAVQLFPVWRHWQYVAARANDGDRLAAAEAAFKALPAARLAALEDFATAFGDIDQLARMHDVPALSFDEKRFIDEHPTVYLGASLWEPLTVQRGTALTGLGIDSVRYHLRRIGVTPVFELRSWEEIVELATRGRLDGVGYVVSSARFQRGFVFTDSVIQAPFVAVIGPAAPFVGSIDDIAELRAAVRAEYEPLRYAIDAAFPDLELTETDGPEAALDALLAGRVDAWLEFLPVVRSTALARPDAETRALRSIDTGLFSSVSMALNVESGLTPLVDLVNRSINSAGSGLQEVQRHWLAGDAPVPPRRWTWLWFMLLSLVLAAGCAHLVRALVRERVRLRRSEAALRRAQLLSGVGSLEIPPPYRRVTLNGDTPRLLGLSREVTEQSLAEHLALFTDEDATLLDAMLETTWRTGRPNAVTVNTAGDDPRRFVYELSPPQRTELHRASVLVTLRDVTEQHRNELRQRALEREVIELQQLDALGRLAAGIAHDFNNVLVVIIGNAELALRDAPEEHPAHEPLRQILQAGLRSRELIAQLLVSVRPPARERRELSLQQVIADTVAMLKAGVPENVTVETELPEAPVVVMGSEVQLSQVFTNLLRNAIDAMPEGGRLTVTLGTEQSPAGAKAVVRVRDTGVGMDEATREQCFEYFYTTRAEGNGLGLAIVRSIVVSHRGRMEVDSAPGRGSEFRVLLPLLQPAPAQEGAAPHATASAPRVLLVDDEDEVRSALASGLRAHGYRVNGVAGGEAALEMLADRANVFDVVLTDLAMGDMSGVELAREIRRRRPELPIVLMAGREDREALRAGAECDRVLDKRISNGDLHSAIEELLAGAPRD